MKKQLYLIIKYTILHFISLFIVISSFIVFAINWPTNNPSGEIEGGKFMSYFSRMWSSCPNGEIFIGYNNNGYKICSNSPLLPTEKKLLQTMK